MASSELEPRGQVVEGQVFRWLCPVCTFHNDGGMFCALCAHSRFLCEDDGRGRPVPMQPARAAAVAAVAPARAGTGLIGAVMNLIPEVNVPTLVNGALAGALTGMFAIVGACTGAVAGALAGRATDSGILRGAGLGMVAGAVVSIEALEASRAFWRNARNPGGAAAATISSTVAYIEDILEERLSMDGGYAPTGGRRWQVDIDDMSYDELYEMFGPGRVAALGITPSALSRIPAYPWHPTEGASIEDKDSTARCPICLEDLEEGEMARTLPLCHHDFHAACVDRWLLMHGICPVCRHGVQG
eukprot:TRINITY_DN174_c0_g1_i1.p1 TRINITY_DN174_c0_g1~~TRINITY_DN174_c0_g1_i1.p1  ORF type:complete len:301 (+),score=41.41 TRINITY_DN174_c0_g1_i1:305-1207(+)